MNPVFYTSREVDNRTDILIAILVACFTAVFLIVSAPHISLTWDEPTYIVAAETYPAWYEKLFTQPTSALSYERVKEYWEFNSEHPPLSKVWSGFVWLGARHIFDDLTAHRLGNILLASVLVALVYLMLAREKGTTAGLVGAAALITMPRFFFHAHLAALDVPVAGMIFAVTFVFWLGHKHSGFRWTLFLGLVWGLALATKINALIVLPITLFLWTIAFWPRRYLFTRLILSGLISLFVFFLSWPWLYHDTLQRLKEYIGFMTTERLPVEQYFLGNLYAPPPWHFPFVITVIVVPFTLLLFAIVGAILSIKHKTDRPLGGLFLTGAFVSLAIFATGQGQVFDNERLFMPVFPYIAALAGIGFVGSIPIMKDPAEKRNISLKITHASTILGILVFSPHLLLAYDLYPHLLSYYSEAIGGAYGAKVLRLESTYWCESYPETFDYLNTNAAPGASVWGECQDVLIYYQLHGKLRSDLKVSRGSEANTVFSKDLLHYGTFNDTDFVIIQYRQSGFYRAMWEWMHARDPVYEYKYRRLRLAEVYVQ
jgi:4-amino-4-deoxy-L-arabinose transferase-like glycosyltransferase